jgi:hypothetical protein
MLRGSERGAHHLYSSKPAYASRLVTCQAGARPAVEPRPPDVAHAGPVAAGAVAGAVSRAERGAQVDAAVGRAEARVADAFAQEA